MPKKLFMILFSTLVLSACGAGFPWRNAPNMPMHPQSGWRWGDQYESNGERIYFSATNQEGERISYTGGPAFGRGMMGSSLTCASCHGDDGRGGTHFMHMQVMDAPDIRYQALSEEEDEHGGEEHTADEHDHGGGSYDLEAFRRAVVEGEHPNGEPLDRDMPRWMMSDQDLTDLFDFIKNLD